ncbi:MAG: hypothetical protein IMZ61_00240 [Planctomycetes bacterium]|nr:hypothetical protein [Thermoplasmata archaeon]MBE3142346.1 hypothetical protein [Planctomycetota bacterium]
MAESNIVLKVDVTDATSKIKALQVKADHLKKTLMECKKLARETHVKNQ